MLSSIYQYADITYVGGAFGKGLHNILEATAFGAPVIFGHRYQKFHEANELPQRQGAFSIHHSEEFKQRFKK